MRRATPCGSTDYRQLSGPSLRVHLTDWNFYPDSRAGFPRRFQQQLPRVFAQSLPNTPQAKPAGLVFTHAAHAVVRNREHVFTALLSGANMHARGPGVLAHVL